jgi:NitT/TauT family transport system permease protein
MFDRLKIGGSRLVLSLLGLAGAVVLWGLLTSSADPGTLTGRFAPDLALPALVDFVGSGVGRHHLIVTLQRLLAGLAAASIVGVVTGVVIGLSDKAADATSGVFQFLRMISPLAWTPIAVAVFGVGDAPVLFLVAVAATWPIVLATSAGIHAVDRAWVEVALSLSATQWEMVRAVYVPAIRAHIATGVRVALGVAWIVIVPAEMLGVDSGLGYAILDARDRLDYPELMGVILLIGILGTGLDLAVRRITTPTSTRHRGGADRPSRKTHSHLIAGGHNGRR